jgi:uncharacterized protein (TIGR01319 family)
MPDNEYRAETILAVDFGTATTRASLFDVVEGTFRYVASGEAPSTAEPPYGDVSEGMRHALLELQEITGRFMLNDAARLIMPSSAEGNGADVFVATFSTGPLVRAVLVGLLPEVSLESARRVAESTYMTVLDHLNLVDGRKQEQQIDVVVKARPHIVLIAGGTNEGAREALLKLAETVGLGCFLLPPEPRAHVVFMGNPALNDRLNELLGNIAVVSTAPNVRPDLANESLDPARAELARVFHELRLTQLGGFPEISNYAGGVMFPTAHAEGQVIRYFSRMTRSPMGVMSVNVGSASTSVAAAFGGELYLTVASDLGLGVNVLNVMNDAPLDQLLRWVPGDFDESAAREFVHWKSVHPHTLPADLDDLYRECALARQALRGALRRARLHWPKDLPGPRADLLPLCDLIVGGGAALSNAPHPGTAALVLLDALQPTGIVNLALDRAHLLAALGAMAHFNPMATVQAMESGALLSLGTVVSVVGAAREGETVCQATLVDSGGKTTKANVKFGSIAVLPLPLNQSGELTLKPRAGIDIGGGPGRGRKADLEGGAVGVIIDARGRPMALPRDATKRAEKLQQWMASLGMA